MTLFASILFLLAIILFDEYKIHREKKELHQNHKNVLKNLTATWKSSKKYRIVNNGLAMYCCQALSPITMLH